MPLARFTFIKCHQCSQEVATKDEHMVSKVFFDLMIVDRDTDISYLYDCLFCEVKQTIGSKLEDGSFEVDLPQGYDGPYEISAITDEIRNYYTESFGPHGKGIRFERAKCLEMRDNMYYKIKPIQFEVRVRQREAGW